MHLNILVFACLLLVDIARAGPPSRPASNQIILSYKTDTHSRHESGIPGRAVQGSYSYIAGDGRWYKVTYEADERGYRAKMSEQLRLPINKPVMTTVPPGAVDAVMMSTAIEGGDILVVKEQITKLPTAETTQNEESIVTVEDADKEEQAPSPSVGAIAEPTEKLAIHVPLFTKVYSLLNKATKAEKKQRKTKAGSPSPIIRYKLSYLPSYGLKIL